jgi:hypothetical protein
LSEVDAAKTTVTGSAAAAGGKLAGAVPQQVVQRGAKICDLLSVRAFRPSQFMPGICILKTI